MMTLKDRLRLFLRCENGTSTLEFVIFLPIVFSILLVAVEIGILMTRYAGLEHAVNVVTRQIRLGQITTVTAASLRTEICKHVFLNPDCSTTTVVELTRIDRSTFAMPSTTAPCVTRTSSAVSVPTTTVTPGQANALMLVRVCTVPNALLPNILVLAPLTYDPQGGYSLTTSAVFVVEP